MATSPTTDEEDPCKFYAIALYDYEPLEKDQLALNAGDLLAVVNDDDLESTGWLGSLNLDTGAAGWVSRDYLHTLDSPSHADAYVQGRPTPLSGDGVPNETLESLTAKLVATALCDGADDSSSLMQNLPSVDAETISIATTDADRRSLGGASLSSMATYGSAYPASSIALGGVDAFLRHQRLHHDGSIHATDSGSNSGSGSSGSTIKSSYPGTSLRTVSSVSGFSFAGSTFSQEGGSSPLSASFDASRRDPVNSLTTPTHRVHHAPSQSLDLSASVSVRVMGHNPHWAASSPPSTSTAPLNQLYRALPNEPSIVGDGTPAVSLIGQSPAYGGGSPLCHSSSDPSPSTPRPPRQERPGLIIPPTRLNALRDAGASPASLQAPTTIPATTSPTRSISMTSDSSGRSSSKGSVSHTTGLTTPSSHTSGGQSFGHGYSSNTPTSITPVSLRSRKMLSSDELNLYDSALREDRRDPVPWYLEPSYQPYELKFNSERVVEAGTLEALVEWLTTPRDRVNPIGIEFRDVFLSTYRSFTDANTLMNLLASRYEMTEPPNLGPAEFEDWKKRKLRPVQMQVLTVLKSWMQDHHMLDAEPEEVPRIREFLTYIKTPEKHEQNAKFMLTLMEKELGGNDVERLPSPLSPSSTVSSSGSSLNSSTRHPRKKGGAPFRRKPTKADPLKFDAADIAAQLTLMEYGMYAKISSNELIKVAKEGDPPGHDVRNLQRYSIFNRKLVKATKHIILTTEPLTKRREVLSHLIRVVEKCRTLHNYAAVHFLMVAITSQCLDKLSSTWQGIDKPQRLESLRALTRSTDLYIAYRNALDAVETGACIPVIGIYLPLLRHLDPIPDNISVELPYSETVELINFTKCRKVASICQQALRFQGRVPSSEHVQENLEVQAWIEEQFDAGGSYSDKWFMDKAVEVQRREEEHSDIRKGLEAAGF